jgi:hypothetical protein
VPVFFRVKPAHASNKTHAIDCTITIPKKDVSYTVKVQTGEGVSRTIYVLKPKIDKITLLFNGLTPEEEKSLPPWLWDLVEDDDFPQYMTAPQKITKGGSRYKTNVIYRTKASRDVLIQADPKKTSGKKAPAFVRLEFNPSKLGPEGMAELADCIKFIFANHITMHQLFLASRVSRIDVACDLVNVASDELLVSTPASGKSHVYYGETGKHETTYLALKKGKSSPQKFYDKAQQLLDADRDQKFGDAAHTRFEKLAAPNIPVTKLVGLKNVFEKFDVRFPVEHHAPGEPYVWALFLDSCRQCGAMTALDKLPETLRPSYQKALDATKHVIWKPTKIWSDWPEVLATSGFLPNHS